MKFKEWFKVEYPNQHVFKESTLTCKSFYNGASVAWDYKQAEIDALQEAVNREREQATEYYTDFHCAIAERDALQKRIDDALNELCRLQYASAERVYHDVSKILKGDKND